MIGLIVGLSELAYTARIVRWERRHPRALVAQELRWWRPPHYAWYRAWGDRSPGGAPSAVSPRSAVGG